MDQILHNLRNSCSQALSRKRSSPVPGSSGWSCNRARIPLEGTHSFSMSPEPAGNTVLHKWQRLCTGAKRDLY